MLRLFVGRCLALERDLLFLKEVLINLNAINRLTIELSANASWLKDKPPKGKTNTSFWGFITSITEKVLFYAQSEIHGFAVIKCSGIMECWNTGFGGRISNFI